MTKAITKKLGRKETNFIAYCEQYYFLRNKGFPTAKEAADRLGYTIAEIQVFMMNRNVQKALEARGLPWKTAGGFNKELTPEQVACALTVLNFADTRDPDTKLKELGVSPQQYFAWLEDPNFYNFVNATADRNFDKIRPEAITQFTSLVRQGNLNAILKYFELTGQFKQPEVHNVQVVIQRLIETVQTHVKDPNVLAAIAKDMLSITPGQQTLELEAELNFTEEEKEFSRKLAGTS